MTRQARKIAWFRMCETILPRAQSCGYFNFSDLHNVNNDQAVAFVLSMVIELLLRL